MGKTGAVGFFSKVNAKITIQCQTAIHCVYVHLKQHGTFPVKRRKIYVNTGLYTIFCEVLSFRFVATESESDWSNAEWGILTLNLQLTERS